MHNKESVIFVERVFTLKVGKLRPSGMEVQPPTAPHRGLIQGLLPSRLWPASGGSGCWALDLHTGGGLASLGSSETSGAGSTVSDSNPHGSPQSEERMPGHGPEPAATAVITHASW